MKPIKIVAIGAVLTGIGMMILLWPAHPMARKTEKPTVASNVPESAALKSLQDLSLHDRKKAEQGYHAFILAHKGDPKLEMQDQVGVARIRTAYLAADRKDFESARNTLMEAAKEYRGTGVAGEFGGIRDGAEYQAAACLSAEGKKEEARAALVKFLKDEPLSPLARAAYRRLVKLNNGVSRPEDEALLTHDIQLQEKKAKQDMVSCGPKALRIYLKLLAKTPPAEDELAKLCKTDKDGTSMENMRDALKRFNDNLLTGFLG